MRKNMISYNKPWIGAAEKKEILKTLSSDWLTAGPKVKLFEQALAKYLGCENIKVLNSCTAALELAILACGIGDGDEVITTPFTFCATINSIIHNRAKPVFVDIDKNNFDIDPLKIESRITKKTKAILVMHYGGMPCDMDIIKKIAKKYKLKVIEDAAHAIGAEYKGEKIGTLSDLTCFSFHATKNMTTGEGGAVSSNSKKAIEFINKVYLHGVDRESWQRHNKHKTGSWGYRVIYPGFKTNMSDIHASLGLKQLEKLDFFNRKRRGIARCYDKYFKEEEYLELQKAPYKIKHAHHIYPIVIKTEFLKVNRNNFIEKLIKKGVRTSVHFIPVYKHPAYKKFFTKKDIARLVNTEYIYNRIISLPIYPRMSLADARYVALAVRDIIKKNKK